MSLKFVFLVLASVITFATATIVEEEWKIYYNLTTNQTFDIIDTNNPRTQLYKSAVAKILRIGFGPIPCSCEDLTCACCSGVNISYFNFNRKACMHFIYDPMEFSLTLDMKMDDESLFTQSISGKNPPPACIPVPIPLGPPIDFCVRFFNIHTPGYNLFLCMDFETRITRAPILILHFDCMQMGVNGIYPMKPEDATLIPDPEGEGETQSPSDIEVYDEVYEEDEKKNKTMSNIKKPEGGGKESEKEKVHEKEKEINKEKENETKKQKENENQKQTESENKKGNETEKEKEKEKQKQKDTETSKEKEVVKETIEETIDETLKETVKETENENLKKTEKENIKETNKKR